MQMELESCRQKGVREREREEFGLTSCEHTNPSTEFENSDEPTFLPGVVDCRAHATIKRGHAVFGDGTVNVVIFKDWRKQLPKNARKDSLDER